MAPFWDIRVKWARQNSELRDCVDGALRDGRMQVGRSLFQSRRCTICSHSVKRSWRGCAAVTSLAHTMAAVHAGVCSTPSARDPGGSYRVMWFHLHVGPPAADPKQKNKELHGVRAIQHHFVILSSLLPYPAAFCSPLCSSYRSGLPSRWPQLPLLPLPSSSFSPFCLDGMRKLSFPSRQKQSSSPDGEASSSHLEISVMPMSLAERS